MLFFGRSHVTSDLGPIRGVVKGYSSQMAGEGNISFRKRVKPNLANSAITIKIISETMKVY